MAVNTGVGPVLARLLHPVHDNPALPAQVSWVAHGVVLKLIERLYGVPDGEELGGLELVLATEATVLVWVCWERSLLKVLLGEAMVTGKYGDVVGATGDQVGISAAIWVNSDTPIWWDVSVAVIAGLWVVWSMRSSTQDRFADPRALGVPWHWRTHLGWLLRKRNVARDRGGEDGGIGEGVKVVEQPVDGEVGDNRAAPRACVG